MQEVSKKAFSFTEELDERSVTIFVQSKLFQLRGEWQWDLVSNVIFCSDVMFNLPAGFIGTKGIIHPDDIAIIHKSIYFRETIGEEDTSDLQFRIITTYGEVRTLTGKNIQFIKDEGDTLLANPAETVFREAAYEAECNRETKLLTLQKDIAEFSERIYKTGSWYFNLSTGESFYSDNYYHLFGLPPQSLNAQLYTFANYLHPEDKSVVLEAIEKSYAEQLPLDIEYRIIRADEALRYLQHTAAVNFNIDGESVVYGLVKDITEQKLLEIELDQDIAKLDLQNRVLEFTDNSAGIGHWQVDILTRKFVFSEQYYKIIGYKSPYIISGLSAITEYIHPDDRQGFIELHRNIINEHTVPDFEFRVVRADGKTRYIALKGKLVVSRKTDLVLIGTIKDITTEKVAEKKLAELKNELFLKGLSYHAAEQMAGMAGWVWDISTDKISWSSNLFALIGIKASADFSFRSLQRYVHPEDRSAFYEHIENAKRYFSGNEFEFRLLTRGETKHFKAMLKAVSEENSRFVICILQNVTRQYELQQKLTDKLYFTELLADTIQEKVIAVDINYSIIEWNKPCEAGFGKMKEDVLFKNFFDTFPDLANSEVVQHFRQVLSGETLSVNTAYKTYLKGHHNVRFSPLHDEHGNVKGILQVMSDITNEVELQSRLNQRLNFIENLVEVSVNPLIVLDRHLNYIYWNKKSEELFRINKEYILGKNILEIFPHTANNPSHHQFKEVLRGETVYIPASESTEGRYHEVYLVPIKDEKNFVTGILWVLHEFTKEIQWIQQQKETQQQILKQQEEFHSLVENIPDVVTRWNKDNQLVFANSAFTKKTGAGNETAFGNINTAIGEYPESTQPWLEKLRQVFETGEPMTYYSSYPAPGGEEFFFTRMVPEKAADGTVQSVLAISSDVTELKKAEQELKQRKNFIERLAAATPDILYLMDLDTRKVTYTNRSVIHVLEYEPGQAAELDDPFFGLMHPDDVQPMLLHIEDIKNEKDGEVREIEYRLKHANGNWVWLKDRNAIFERDKHGKPTSKIGITENIHEKKQQEEELIAHLKIVDQFEQLANLGSWEYDIATRSFNWSEGMYRLFGISKGEKVAPEVYVEHAKEDDRAIAEKITAAIRKADEPFEEVMRIHQGASERTLKIKGSVITNEKGRRVKFVGVDMDISDGVQAEAKIRESEYLLRQTTEATPDAITIFDLVKKEPLYLNNRLGLWLGYSNEELVETGFEGRLELLHPDDRDTLLEHNKGMLSATDGDVKSVEYRLRSRTGQTIWILNRTKVFSRDDKGNVTHILSVLQNISDRKK